MSLCVAWKYEEGDKSEVYFAADSCAVDRTNVMPFSGIKVLEIPIQIKSAMDATTGHGETLSSVTYGMAFAGSYLTAFLLKELVAETLSHAQFLGSPDSITFKKICEVVLRCHRYFHDQIRDHHDHDYEVDFFLGGYCGEARRVRVAKFFVDLGTGEPTYREILTQTGFSWETIGIEPAQKRFAELIKLSLSGPPCRVHFAVFRRLKDIICDTEHPFVAGAIQHGEFVGNSFKLAGSSDVVLRDGRLEVKWYVRGTDCDVVQGPGGFGDLHFGGYSFRVPFNEDVQGFDLSGSFWESKPIHHVVDEQITIVPYDLRWPARYGDKLRTLRSVLGDLPIEHIGSTAVPGMAAVPIIDVMVGVDELGDVKQPPLCLDSDLYEYLRDGIISGQRVYRDRIGEAYDIYVVGKDGEFWQNAIRLREYLRQNNDERSAYSCEKAKILNTGSWTLVRYLNAKANYLNQLIARASAPPQQSA